jgi:hypothetical protein
VAGSLCDALPAIARTIAQTLSRPRGVFRHHKKGLRRSRVRRDLSHCKGVMASKSLLVRHSCDAADALADTLAIVRYAHTGRVVAWSIQRRRKRAQTGSPSLYGPGQERCAIFSRDACGAGGRHAGSCLCPDADRPGIDNRGRDRGALDGALPPSPPRRHPAQAQPRRSRACRGSLPDRHRHRQAALEGFSPTPEMPEITEAEELLAAVAQWSARNGSARR